jgi:hypothetical protein
LIGKRLRVYFDAKDLRTLRAYMGDLASRLAVRVQLTTYGLKGYPEAVELTFRGNVDYGMLNKSYANGAG